MKKQTTIILKSKDKKIKYVINQDIDYLSYAIEEYAEREGWEIKDE
jgi:hypothetical protein